MSHDMYYGFCCYMLCLFTLTYQIRTARTQYRKFETNIPSKGIAWPQPNFHIHVSVSDLYIPRISLPILLQENMWTDSGNIQIAHRHKNA
jgi:hypothetical protein